MKLISYGAAGSEQPGVLCEDGNILDLRLASGGVIHTIRQLLERGESCMQQVAAWIEEGPRENWLRPARGTRLGPPVTNPSKIVCLGLNYHSHAEEQNARIPERPLLFSKAVTSLAGDGDSIWFPIEEEHVDYEAELALVIGRPAFRVNPADWEMYVAGYTIVNDVSARDAQWADRKWFRGKSYDSFCPMGPTIVTRDEIPDPHDLRLTATLNGELRQDGHTSDLIFRIPDILAFASRNITFLPGDVIATGTPCGVGIFRDPPACMRPGDEISVHLEGVGDLTNTVQERTEELPSVYPAPQESAR
jgi:2-keto-4-pentenoate hydratase/2-oxohepta-3-ene-1,7-dioic acid hydratase in catechol pathway